MPLALLLPLLLAATQDAAPVCPATPAALPAALAGWKSGTPVAVGTSDASIPPLTLGTRADVTLADASAVRYVVKLARPVAPGSKGGLLAFLVKQPGTYRVALGTGAWIDVVAGTKGGDGKLLTSSAHAHGPDCSGIRKMVDFAFVPGAYVLQISESRDAVTGVLVTPLP